MNIRAFADADAADVAALWSDIFPDPRAWNQAAAYIARKRGTQRELFLVGEDAGRIMATVLAGYDGVRGWIYHLAVAPSARRRGHGAALMRAAEAALAARGCPKVNLQVVAENAGVVRFYERLGYAVEPRVSMGKVLAS
ncbi:MAG: GNAT family acetyltransferase [Deltaproteobacteria bacterium]|nr:GNAT family acetyltransferase [Deltaproteobacteria bacterium]